MPRTKRKTQDPKRSALQTQLALCREDFECFYVGRLKPELDRLDKIRERIAWLQRQLTKLGK